MFFRTQLTWITAANTLKSNQLDSIWIPGVCELLVLFGEARGWRANLFHVGQIYNVHIIIHTNHILHHAGYTAHTRQPGLDSAHHTDDEYICPDWYASISKMYVTKRESVVPVSSTDHTDHLQIDQLDHPDPNLLLFYAVQDLYSSYPTRESYPTSCRLHGSHLATRARFCTSHR